MLLEEELRPAAFALQSTYGSFGMMAGPALAGLLIGALGLRSTYTVDVVTYVLALMLFVRIAASPPVNEADGRASILDGVRFLRGSLVMSVFGDRILRAMVFGMPWRCSPALAQRLGGGPGIYGSLLASSVGGGRLRAPRSPADGRHAHRPAGPGLAADLRRRARGKAIAAAGLTKSTPLVLVLFAVAGGADMISGVYRSTIAAGVTRDEMRGRVSGVEIAVYAGGPVLGDVEAGEVGGLPGPPFCHRLRRPGVHRRRRPVRGVQALDGPLPVPNWAASA